jgi:transcriptional regulator with XRE-family HTH domain
MNVNNPGSLTGYNIGYTLPDMNSMAERVREMRKKRKLSQAQLAELVGCSQPQITKIEQGGDTSLILELATALQVDAEWLKHGVQSSGKTHQTSSDAANVAEGAEVDNAGQSMSRARRSAQVPTSDAGDTYIYLPRLVITPSESGGKLTWQLDDIGELEAFPRVQADRLSVREDSSAFVAAPDDGMAPRIVKDDSLVVDYNDKVIVDGAVYALIYGNTFAVRRIFVEPGAYTIAPDNQHDGRYRAFKLDEADLAKVSIIGRIKAMIGSI